MSGSTASVDIQKLKTVGSLEDFARHRDIKTALDMGGDGSSIGGSGKCQNLDHLGKLHVDLRMFVGKKELARTILIENESDGLKASVIVRKRR